MWLSMGGNFGYGKRLVNGVGSPDEEPILNIEVSPNRVSETLDLNIPEDGLDVDRPEQYLAKGM